MRTTLQPMIAVSALLLAFARVFTELGAAIILGVLVRPVAALLSRLRLSGPLWRRGDFLRLWAGQTISQFGTQIDDLALGLVAIIVLDATAFEVAVYGTVNFLPFILFTVLGSLPFTFTFSTSSTCRCGSVSG